MNGTTRRLNPHRIWLPVLFITILILGVVGIQVVLIAHTQKMITGQPLLQGQDHQDLSHSPPLFLYHAGRAAHRSCPSPFRRAPAAESSTLLKDDWENLPPVPFVSLGEDGNCYVILMEAPDISPHTIDIRLQGRELAIQTRPSVETASSTSRIARIGSSGWGRRIRLPGPVSATGPPTPQLSAPGRLRIIVRKADHPADAESGMTML